MVMNRHGRVDWEWTPFEITAPRDGVRVKEARAILSHRFIVVRHVGEACWHAYQRRTGDSEHPWSELDRYQWDWLGRHPSERAAKRTCEKLIPPR